MKVVSNRVSHITSHRSLSYLKDYFQHEFPSFVIIYKFNDWYRVFDNDAEIFSNLFDFYIFKYNNLYDCCGFPNLSLSRIEYTLKRFNINYIKIDIKEDYYELLDFEKDNEYDKALNLSYNIVRYKPESGKVNNGIQIGDLVSIRNLETNEIEKYTIIKAYYEYTPMGISRNSYNFGGIINKETPISEIDPDNGIISSDSKVAQILLNRCLNEIIELPDGKYQIIKISKPTDVE